jgi:ABC-2 type transport system permease protein
MNTSLLTLGRPDELRQRLFSRSLAITTAAPLASPDQVFAGLPAVQGWRLAEPAGGGTAGYVLTVSDPALAAPAVTRALGEREQGTLEPVLTTPVRREELLIGKAAAIFLPAIGLAYLVFGIFLAVVRLGANPVIATAVWHSPELPAEALFIPLLAGWAIWICLAISARASDIRIAQQLGILSSLPPAALTALMSFQVINPTLPLAASLAGALLVIDCGAYVFVSRLFDRERLVTGTKPGGTSTGV